VYGWDLALATGKRPEWGDEVLGAAYRDVARTAEQGRAMGIYVGRRAGTGTVSLLDRTLGLTGRAPSWTAGVRGPTS